jgi:hypothetical protein
VAKDLAFRSRTLYIPKSLLVKPAEHRQPAVNVHGRHVGPASPHRTRTLKTRLSNTAVSPLPVRNPRYWDSFSSCPAEPATLDWRLDMDASHDPIWILLRELRFTGSAGDPTSFPLPPAVVLCGQTQPRFSAYPYRGSFNSLKMHKSVFLLPQASTHIRVV